MTIALKIIMHSDVHKFLDTHIDTGDSTNVQQLNSPAMRGLNLCREDCC